MKSSGVVILLFISLYFVHGKPYPSSTAEKESTTTTEKPWLRFLKDKKTTTTIATTQIPSLHHKPLNVILSPTLFSHPASVRAVGPAPGSQSALSQSSIDTFLNNLVAYFEPSKLTASQYVPTAPSVLAQDRKLNPDTMYDELYLDWMKRQADPMAPASLPEPLTPEDGYKTPGPAADQSYPPYVYPTMPLYNPYFPLSAFKMQKAMVQAQMDAALTAMNITTTPKPIKLKLKITIPGGADLSQLSSITNGLPPGSTFSLD